MPSCAVFIRLFPAVFHLFFICLLALVFSNPVCAAATDANDLPIHPNSEQPALLLELGSASVTTSRLLPGVQAIQGQVLQDPQAGVSWQVEPEAVNVLYPGFGEWQATFRFNVNQPITASFRFWARWRQGGDPTVCRQTFAIWAGPDVNHLQQRGSVQLMPKGWEYAWLSSPEPIQFKAGDRVIEVRNSGAGHDAKVFDAFLLASPWAELPVTATVEQPALLLELGKAAVLFALPKPNHLTAVQGTAEAGANTGALAIEQDEALLFHSGFGDWSGSFRFPLPADSKPGQYRLWARYKSGGEVSQVKQNFIVKAGAQPDELAMRGEFALTNATPWEYQWLPAAETVTLLPGDRWLTLENSGKADGAKVFDAFLLQMQQPLASAMTSEQAQLRNRFLALTRPDAKGPQRLLVLDGSGAHGERLFRGLAADAARTHYQNMPVSYMIGQAAETMAHDLNLPSLPAVVLTDDHHTVLGVLTELADEGSVAKFLADPDRHDWMPQPLVVAAPTPAPLKNGIPEAWLIGGLQDGQAGLSVFGLDTETVLRPNPDQPYLSLEMMGGKIRNWRVAATEANAETTLAASTEHAYGWSRGTGYAQLYLRADRLVHAQLHLRQSGIKTAAWLDGQALILADDAQLPAGFKPSQEAQSQALLHGLTTEGLLATANAERPQVPQVAALNLAPGWHSLLVKLVMQHDQGQRFYFSGLFTDVGGKPLDGLHTQTADPNADLALNKIAAKLRPVISNTAPANLPHPGEPIKISVDLRWQPILEEAKLDTPLPQFPAKLRLWLVDYNGKQIAEREIRARFPGQVEADFGKLDQPGYYAIYPSLFAEDGRVIMDYPADGFSVVAGNAAQKQRLAHKKVWNNDYYALADGDKSFKQSGGYFVWLERMGLFRSLGSYPGFESKYRPLWEQAKQRGIEFFADSSGDSNWLNDKPGDGKNFVNAAAAYTRYFKATNEIDIRHEADWQKLREPAHWVERAKWEYQQVHQARNNAHYVGGSLVRPGEGDWFKQVLQLGLDNYQDAWDVHAYPQQAPRFGGPIGNGANEDERGVLAAYFSLGKTNKLPFWLGETGAKAMHGFSGRRWQAEQVAKIIAWVNSRQDYLGVAFCIAHEYDLAYGRIWDYSLGHKPGEAALYTASALIDGLPYRPVDTHDANVQAGYFGETLMIWREQGEGEWPLQLGAQKAWVAVDVVGQVLDLAVDSAGKASVSISSSPVYLLPRADYLNLLRD
ncbi:MULTISPECIES: hypothetical protein [Methylomonas]|uniref:Glycoside hydrolase family 42 N-terminal domain-containing protein n=2 Tax=Methylomonas TaxID=416 RepID=A0A126T2U8_9GAMM|nr:MULTISPECIES: hypothetical protein [Methylomonas]AMK76064.1 hypothetical protein JT25_006080 [Methylomonas denitrificans]OAH99807.1 hypothetical protein A1342_16695 [Methylomonas methanica]TCV83915.1 hypothetical protein EDE11_10845 [Methylomonas methanica]